MIAKWGLPHRSIIAERTQKGQKTSRRLPHKNIIVVTEHKNIKTQKISASSFFQTENHEKLYTIIITEIIPKILREIFQISKEIKAL